MRTRLSRGRRTAAPVRQPIPPASAIATPAPEGIVAPTPVRLALTATLVVTLVALAVVPALYAPSILLSGDGLRLDALRLATGACLLLLAVPVLLTGGSVLRPRSVPSYVLWGAATLAASIVASTLLSVDPQVSFWGSYPWQRGTFSSLQLTLLLLFGLIALSCRSARDRACFAAAVAVSGTLVGAVGVVQYGWGDPFGWQGPGQRIISSLGNPIYVAEFLGCTSLITLALASAAGLGMWRNRPMGGRALRSAATGAVLATLAAGVQLAALVLTQSRGAFLGAAAGLAVLFVLAFVASRRLAASAVGSAAVAGALGAAILIVLPSTEAGGSLGVAGRRMQTAVEYVEQGLTPTDSSGVAAPNLGSVYEAEHHRVLTWQLEWDLIRNRPWPEVLGESNALVRHLFGYGPDTTPIVNNIRYTALLIDLAPQTRQYHAHNLTLQLLVEHGILGLIAFYGFAGLCVWAAFQEIRWVRSAGVAPDADPSWSPVPAAVSVGAIAAVAARLVAQQTGVPTTGADIAYWGALALAATAAIAAGTARRGHSGRGHAVHLAPEGQRYQWPLPLALGGLGLFMLWSGAASALAEKAAVQGLNAMDQNQHEIAERRLVEASAMSPWPAFYDLTLAAFYFNLAPAAANTGDAEFVTELVLQSRGYLDKVLSQDPLSLSAGVARAWLRTLEASQNPRQRELALASYRRLEALAPQEHAIYIQWATAHLNWNEPDAALRVLDRQFNASVPAFQVSFLRARAHARAGRREQATLALDEAIRLAPPEERARLESTRVDLTGAGR